MSCPLKRPQDVIFILLHCTNTYSFISLITLSSCSFFPVTPPPISKLFLFLHHPPPHTTQQPCPPKCKTVHHHRHNLPPINNNTIINIKNSLWAVTSLRSGETGTPSGSTWRTRAPQLHSLSATSTTSWTSSVTSTSLGKPRFTCTVASSSASPLLLRRAPALSGRPGEASTPSSDVFGQPMRSTAARRRLTPSAAEPFGYTSVRSRSASQRQEGSLIRRRRRRWGTKLRALLRVQRLSSNWLLDPSDHVIYIWMVNLFYHNHNIYLSCI